MSKIYVGDTGKILRVALKEDLTDMTTVIYEITRPDKTKVNWTGNVEVASTGIVYYPTVEGDLNQSGDWTFQIYMIFNNGDKLRANSGHFRVYEKGE